MKCSAKTFQYAVSRHTSLGALKMYMPSSWNRCIHTQALSNQHSKPIRQFFCLSQEISLEATDSAGATASAVLRFVVLPENDPPVLEMASATYNSDLTHDGLSAVIESVEQLTINEDEVSAIPGLSVRDVDLDVDGAYIFGGDPGSVDAGVVEVTLYASNGTTSLRAELNEYTFLVGDGVDDGIMSFRASLGGANRALAGLTYRGKIDFYGTDDIVVTVDDGGRFGRGSLCEESAMRGAGELDGSYATCPQVTSPTRRSIICQIPLGFDSKSRQLNRFSGSSEFGHKIDTNSTGCIQSQKNIFLSWGIKPSRSVPRWVMQRTGQGKNILPKRECSLLGATRVWQRVLDNKNGRH